MGVPAVWPLLSGIPRSWDAFTLYAFSHQSCAPDPTDAADRATLAVSRVARAGTLPIHYTPPEHRPAYVQAGTLGVTRAVQWGTAR